MTPAPPKPARARRKPWTADDLRSWRARLGLSQPQAAERIGIPVATIRHYEQAQRRADKAGLPALLVARCRCIEEHGAA
jgi:DNA-binding transcriptional regulator YiaG